jgi:hypothetical protein
MEHSEQRALAEFYQRHPEILNCVANTNALVAYHAGDDITLQSLEESASFVSLSRQSQRSKATFPSYCRENRISDCEANLRLYLAHDDGGYASATPAELAEWRNQAIGDYNAALKTALPSELRAEVRSQAQQRRVAEVQELADQRLAEITKRDAAIGYPALPAHINAAYIKAAAPDTIRLLIRKYGNAQIDLRLRG